MHLRRCAYAIAMFALVLQSHAFATESAPSVPISKAAAPFMLDAALTDQRWSTAKRVTAFTDLSSRDKPKSNTESALFYDDRNIYVAFWCAQDAPIVSTQTTNNAGFGGDDFVGVGIDPSGNAERTYYFEVTPNGTKYAQSNESTRYLPNWSAAARRTEHGWNALLIIPLAAMKLPRGEQAWNVNLVRSAISTGEKISSSFNSNVQMDSGTGFPSLGDARNWQPLRGLVITARPPKARPAAALYTLESVGKDAKTFVAPDNTVFAHSPRVLGLDIQYPLTSTVSFVGTVNPDFSNVDADQVTIAPQIYQRNLQEYRPFFAQGAAFINNAATALGINEPVNVAFYSPSIGVFDRGLKFEGTYRAYQSFALLEAKGTNQATSQGFDDIAFGWKHVLPGRPFGFWTNGVVANHGSLHDATVEVGIQARDLRSGWVGALFHESEKTSSPLERHSAYSTYGFVDHQNSRHEALIAFRNISPRFHPVDGFTQVADIHGIGGEYIAYFGGGSRGIKNGTADLFLGRYLDSSGAVHKADMGLSLSATLRSDVVLSAGTDATEARSYDGDFFDGFASSYKNGLTQRFDQSYLGVAVKPSSPVPAAVRYSWGPFGDFYLQQVSAAGARPLSQRLSASWEYDGSLERGRNGADSQWLRRISLRYSLGADTTFSLGVRAISGTGGFADPGTNLSATFHRLFSNGEELYASFGAPSASRTMNRFVLKFVIKTPERQ